ncbi:hypothetical protein [Actimicrobium antarcticum]|uniref:hypothetical protein n=1 Tax=Actimicrobium antarcticum TaxID=1051899 RepID=UPI0031D9B18A
MLTSIDNGAKNAILQVGGTCICVAGLLRIGDTRISALTAARHNTVGAHGVRINYSKVMAQKNALMR